MKKKKSSSKRRARRVARAIRVNRDVTRGVIADVFDDVTVPPMLQRVAGALNHIESAGIRVRLAHGALITEHGYVFWVNGKWVTRTLQLTEPEIRASGEED